MTAYSFGNRWVGIIALREPQSAVPVPLHILARQLRTVRDGSFNIGGTVLSLSGVLSLLDGVAHRLVLGQQWRRLEQCDDARYLLARKRSIDLPSWLTTAILVERERQRERQTVRRAKTSAKAPGARVAEPMAIRAAQSLTKTRWSGVPSPPVPLELPELSVGARALARDLGISTNGLEAWLRWACAHKSWVHETWAEPPVSLAALRLLDDLGAAWVEVALIDRARKERGAFDGPAAVAEVVRTYESQVWAALGERVRSEDVALLGRGERNNSTGKAAEAVARQFVGAMCLAEGNYLSAVRAVATVESGPAAQELDWVSLLYEVTQNRPVIEVQHAGPEHARTFSVTVRGAGKKAAVGEGTSLKGARREAARAYITAHAPDVVKPGRGRNDSGPPGAAPRPIGTSSAHRDAISHVARIFELDERSFPWISQSLMHRSWEHENRAQARTARQSSYQVLAAEGARVVNALSAHRHAVDVFTVSTNPTAEDARFHTTTAETYAELFDALKIGNGILLGRGSRLTNAICADISQAVLGAAWREKRETLIQRQPQQLVDWLDALVPDLDPATVLDRYCAALGLTSEQGYTSDGPQDDRLYRSTWILGEPLTWTGPWRRSKTKAKVATADEIIALILDAVSADGELLDVDEQRLAVYFFENEVRAGRVRDHRAGWDLSFRRFAVDRLKRGDLARYVRWADVMDNRIAHHHADANSVRDSFERQLAQALTAELVSSVDQISARWGTASNDASSMAARSRVLHGLTEFARAIQMLPSRATTTRAQDALSSTVQAIVAEMGIALEATHETHTETDDVETTLTARVTGVDLSRALADMLDVLCTLTYGASWEKTVDGGIAVHRPRPESAKSGLGRAGLNALVEASYAAATRISSRLMPTASA